MTALMHLCDGDGDGDSGYALCGIPLGLLRDFEDGEKLGGECQSCSVARREIGQHRRDEMGNRP